MQQTRATGTIDVRTFVPTPYDEPDDGPSLVRIHVEETFAGDVTGEGVVDFLQVLLADASASFVGIERVTGSLAGRTGTFVLQDAGTLADGEVTGTWFVVPGSGTGELSGLRGEGGFTAVAGQHAKIHLDYWFE